MGPIQIGPFNLDDARGVADYVKKLVQARHDGNIQDSAIFSLHALVGDLIKIYLPQSTEVNVTQQVAVNPEQIITGFLNGLPAELRNGIIAYGRQQTKLEQVAV